MLYFAANDSNAIKLIEHAEKLETRLDNVQAIKMYELIFYLYRTDQSDKKGLRILYKYQYYTILLYVNQLTLERTIFHLTITQTTDNYSKVMKRSEGNV
nr:hypothetical protein [Sedimentibacter sp.]